MEKIYVKNYSNYPIPYLNVKNYNFDLNIIKIIKKQLALKYFSIPIDIIGNILTIAMGNPNFETINILEKITKKRIKIFKSDKQQILCKINQLYKRSVKNEL